MKAPFLAAILAAFQLLVVSEKAAALVAPILLTPGLTVSPLPNGFSSGDGTTNTKPFDQTQVFSFLNGPSGTLRERILDYSDTPSVDHPGLYFDFEIQLTSGSVTAFTVPGYASFDTSVKECGISGCGGSGANGVVATSASRSTDGNQITFDFGDTLTAGEHSANLQIFTSALLFQDPMAFFVDASGNLFAIDVAAPAVPEPATWSLMILGFWGVGFMRHRKRLRR